MGKKLRFLGQTAVIVGGSKGIGKATAAEFVKSGANVCIIARTQEILNQVKEELEKLKPKKDQKITIIAADATNEEQMKSALDHFVQENGVPNILINVVGGSVYKGVKPDYIQNHTVSDFEMIMKFNFTSTVTSILTLLPHFLKDKQKSHYIVNFSSIAGYIGLMGYSTYSSSKFAIVGLSEALRHELKPYNINVSVVYPPDTETPGFQEDEELRPKELSIVASAAKVLKAEDVAKAVVKGISKKKFSITPGSAGWMNWIKRHMPGLVYWFIDRDLKSARKKFGKE
ncbi:MAG: SDR family oxidoreductase [Candidatus Helarchaeota archaeon]